jgi:hypothetical protein
MVDLEPFVLVAEVEIAVECYRARVGVVPEGITTKPVTQKMKLSQHDEQHDQQTGPARNATAVSKMAKAEKRDRQKRPEKITANFRSPRDRKSSAHNDENEIGQDEAQSQVNPKSRMNLR